MNCYNNRVQILLRQSGEPPVTLLSLEGVTQVEHLLVVRYVVILVPLAEEIRSSYPGLLFPFYVGNVRFDRFVRRSDQC